MLITSDIFSQTVFMKYQYNSEDITSEIFIHFAEVCTHFGGLVVFRIAKFNSHFFL